MTQMTITVDVTPENVEKVKIFFEGNQTLLPPMGTVPVAVAPPQAIAPPQVEVAPPMAVTPPQAVAPPQVEATPLMAVAPPPAIAPPQAVAPIPPRDVNSELLMLATALSQSNKGPQMQALFGQFGITKLPDIYAKPELIPSFKAALEALHG